MENPQGRRKNPEVKDFKRLNKVVLKEGGTNAAVSDSIKITFNNHLHILVEPCHESKP